MFKDPLSLFIEESVDLVKNDYYKYIFRTKQAFFRALIDNTTSIEFEKIVDSIWSNVDHKFMQQRIKELGDMISESNQKGHKIKNPKAVLEEIFEVKKPSFFIKYENKYADNINSYYKRRYETIKDGYVNKDRYLTDLVEKYDIYQNNIPYYNKDGSVRSYHNIADYNSMVYNTSLNNSGWNRTKYDSELLENDLVYLPAHPFACPLCIEWQGKVYSISGKSSKYPNQQEAINGGVGHPHCKHQWTIYWDESQIQSNKFNTNAWDEKYTNKQKTRSLQLKRTKLKTDMEIYKNIGNYAEVDKAKSKMSMLNSKIKDLKSEL